MISEPGKRAKEGEEEGGFYDTGQGWATKPADEKRRQGGEKCRKQTGIRHIFISVSIKDLKIPGPMLWKTSLFLAFCSCF